MVDIRKIRELVIIAMFADDELMEKFVLKGGNALDIAHNMNLRASIDIDFSMEDDFEDIDDIRSRIENALIDRFDTINYKIFDFKLSSKPRKPQNEPSWWGGYEISFKIIESKKYQDLLGDIDNLRRNSATIGPEQKRNFKIDISKYEYCESKEEIELNDYIIYVYTLPMIVIEKLRALCQQLSEYELTSPRARARDVFDIYSIITEKSVNVTTEENRELFKYIFSAKQVKLSLLSQLGTQRDFHRTDWPSVEQSVSISLKDFDYYYDFLENLVEQLKSFWEE